jgi:hypothetical protein
MVLSHDMVSQNATEQGSACEEPRPCMDVCPGVEVCASDERRTCGVQGEQKGVPRTMI